MSTRRFEFVAGNSAKFWEITTHGRDVRVRYGRLGTSGQVQSQSFLSEIAASQHAGRRITEKLGKGYVEIAVA